MNLTTESILLIIGAIGVVAVNIITAMRTNAKVHAVESKADVIQEKVTTVAVATNGKQDNLEQRVQQLTAQLSEQNQVAVDLARASVERRRLTDTLGVPRRRKKTTTRR